MKLEEFIEEWENGADYVMGHTSGSTGAPKPIKLLKADMRASARGTNSFFGIGKDSILALPLSLDYIAGKMMAVRAIEAGCRLMVIEPSNRFDWPERCDLLSIVPSQAPWLLEHPEGPRQIKNVIIGGGPLDETVRRRIVDAGYRAYCSYGMTETCSHVALARVAIQPLPYEAMPGISFGLDARGCLCIQTRNFSFELLVTNDMVELIDDRHFYWKGRIDNVINSGGLKIHPEILEKEISAIITEAFYIIGVPDERWGQAVGLVIEGTAQTAVEAYEKLRTALDHRFLPKRVWAVEAIRRTMSAKLIREIPSKMPLSL
ncbi:MAG: AMP-binding protein [Bacteroidales bacterium]|nr:AMP-binding protein [Bacteroidales bacterium]